MSHLQADTISLIRNVLNEQYDLDSILKELVQNADDSYASCLHFAWMPGWPDDPHPLLRDPALVVLNDGEFLPQDCQGIRRLGIGGKGDDASKVGKFGLGLKSVFHICEAFFYLGSPDQPGANGQPLCDIINPWPSELNIHNDWDDIGDGSNRITKRILSWEPSSGRWFWLFGFHFGPMYNWEIRKLCGAGLERSPRRKAYLQVTSPCAPQLCSLLLDTCNQFNSGTGTRQLSALCPAIAFS